MSRKQNSQIKMKKIQKININQLNNILQLIKLKLMKSKVLLKYPLISNTHLLLYKYMTQKHTNLFHKLS